MGDSFCVLSKALFCIHHDTLLSKLNLAQFMNGSNHTLVIYIGMVIKITNFDHDIFSDWVVIKHGVPQG